MPDNGKQDSDSEYSDFDSFEELSISEVDSEGEDDDFLVEEVSDDDDEIDPDDIAAEMDVDDSDESGAEEGTRMSYQKDMWQIRMFPYSEEMRQNADEYFTYVKTGLGRAVLHRNSRPGLVFWTQELNRFLALYGRRFTKRDHIHMVKLLYSAVIAEKLDFSIVQAISSILCQLLCRKSLLNRKDLTLEWKPLYKLYYEVTYKNLEEEGVFLLPEDVKKSLEKLIHYACPFFADEATQEILDELRPFFCPLDDCFSKGLCLSYHFLPTCLTQEEHAKFGAGLWFEEYWHWYSEADPTATTETLFAQIFGKLAKDSPFFVDYSDRMDVIFSQLLHSFKLDVGSDRVNVWTSSNVFSHMANLITYNLGGEKNITQEYLNKLFRTVENYFHPSNNGQYTQNLINFVVLLSNEVVNRVSRERYNYKKHIIPIPEQYRLTDAQVDAFVKSILPCLEYAAFSKVKHEYVPSIMRVLSFLSPGLIIPSVLDLVYPALETVTEPHRLMQSLYILAGICVSLVRDDTTKSKGERRALKYTESIEPEAHLKSFRIHAINILCNILPGIDMNDTVKTTLTVQITVVLLLLIPVHDCSEAIYIRDDLTEEEKELCAATARFDPFVDQLLERLFNMLEVFGNNPGVNAHNTRLNLTKPRQKSVEEMVLERGIGGVIRSLLKNCSVAIYEKTLNFFYGFLTRTLADSRPVMDTLRSLIPIFILHSPDRAFPLFFDFTFNKLKLAITEDVLNEDEVDSSLIWYLNMFAEVVHGAPGVFLTRKREEINTIIELGMQFKCKDAINVMGRIIQNTISSLTSFFPISSSVKKEKDLGLDEYLPIRDWARTIDKKSWDLKWHLPTDEDIAYAQQMVNRIVFYQLDRLRDSKEVDKLSHNDLQKRLIFVRCAILGGSKLMPFMEGSPLEQLNDEPAGLFVDTIFLPRNMKCLTSTDGRNLRNVVFERINTLADYVLKNRENDTKTMVEIIGILRILLHVRGVDEKSYQPLLSTYRSTKGNLADPLRGPSVNIESVMEDSLVFMHVKRCIYKHPLSLNSTHLDVFRLLIRLSTSTYSAVRIQAQRVLDSCFNTWARSYKFVLDDILYYIQNGAQLTHEQFKGALYILYTGKSRSIALRQDWISLLKIWPCLVKAQFSEKPSIVALLDSIHDMFMNNFASFEIYFTFPDNVLEHARNLLVNYDGCIHPPDYPGFNYMTEAESKQLEAQRNAENVKIYYELCSQLVQLANDSTLHWRHAELAQSLLSLLLRRDIEYPKDAVIIFTKLLASDTIRTRKTAVSLMSSWLKINKPKANRVVFNFDKGENGPGAKAPIKYGIREDNKWVLFKPEDTPRSEEQWNNTDFHAKPFWGYYTWPKEYRGYAAPSKQTQINRTRDSLNATEKEVLALLTDSAHLGRVLQLMSVEEKKGSEEFSASTYSFFYGLTRQFNTDIVEALRPFVDHYISSKAEASQRLAAEMVSGILKGAKLWTFDKLIPLRNWLGPKIIAVLEGMSNEIEGLWAQAIVSIFFDLEPRQTYWLYELLMQLWKKPTDNSYHISARMYFLHCAASQWEWRSVALWHELVQLVKPFIGHSLQNLRSRVSSIISDACQYEYRRMYVLPTLEERLKPLCFREVANAIKNEVPKMFGVAAGSINKIPSGVELMEMGENSTPENGDDLKKERMMMLTFINMLSLSSSQCTEPHVLQFMPLLAHYSNDTKDDELKNGCNLILLHVMSVVPVHKTNINSLLQNIADALNTCTWWKARVTLLKFLQVAVFSNVFSLSHAVDDICRLLFHFLNDTQLEVRICAADTISGFINCGYVSVNDNLLAVINEMANSQEPLRRHAGVLGLAAIIQAFPYTVPTFLPDVLMKLCRYASERQPIQATVKKALSEFKRTHQDCWHEHKQEFTDDQLTVLTGLLVSPNYYV
uniref:Proteasome activator complex subunit 4 n=1 Tax=Bursaphelenchus xylophilus TaxID=6326 RepID=A0A1I7RNY6_BURXY